MHITFTVPFKALPLENRGKRTVVFTTVDNGAEMSNLLIVTTNAYLQLQNCHGTRGEFKEGNVTLNDPFDKELARRLSVQIGVFLHTECYAERSK
jgi:hypothetical protein